MALNDEATLWGADLLVVGSRGHGAFSRLLLGSVASSVVRGAPCSVEIVRRPVGATKQRLGEKILLGIDGSSCSLDAVRSVVSRPWPDGTSLRLVSVAPSARVLTGAWTIPEATRAELERASRRAAEEAIDAARALAGPAVSASAAVLEGDPRSCLVHECGRWEADLLVVGSHGRRGLDRFFFGSVSEAVAIHAPCSVEVVRGGGGARADPGV
jgi:nucleotide-binding universal stress UspA family protein